MFMMRILSSFIETIGILYDWHIVIDENQGENECTSLYDIYGPKIQRPAIIRLRSNGPGQPRRPDCLLRLG